MKKRLFDRNLVYPSDSIGPFTELLGVVTVVDELEVTVRTPEHGEFTGFASQPPKVGYIAWIRIYNAGGGWYPDNRITRWSSGQTWVST